MINRESFYAKYKTHFGKLNVSQVEGLNFLLEKLDASEVFNLANEYAYVLSTIKHYALEVRVDIYIYKTGILRV